MEPTHLDNAPIVEALLDIRVQPAEGMTVERLSALVPRFAEAFPEGRPRFRITQQLDVNAETPGLAPTKEIDGYIFTSVDKHRVVQVQPEGFSLSILPKYKDWDELRDEARKWWAVYAELAQPRRVARIGARYINRILLPLPVADLKDWLCTYPEIGSELPQGLAEYLLRLVVPLKNGMGIITQAIQPRDPTCPDRVPIILDVDAFREAEFTPLSDSLWTAIEELRDAKNALFFGSITSRTADLYR